MPKLHTTIYSDLPDWCLQKPSLEAEGEKQGLKIYWDIYKCDNIFQPVWFYDKSFFIAPENLEDGDQKSNIFGFVIGKSDPKCFSYEWKEI